MLLEWHRRPHVAEWWDLAASIDELRNHFFEPRTNPPDVRGYIARRGRLPVGFIQSYVVKDAGDGWWPDETDPGARGIDQFLAEAGDLGKGHGRSMIRAFVDRLFEDSAVTVVQTDPDPRNERAIRCYRAAGFRDVGVVETPDGPAFLMRCARAQTGAVMVPRSFSWRSQPSPQRPWPRAIGC